MTSPDWAAARTSVPLDPTVTMLNTGSWGPVPTPVHDRAAELRRVLAAGPTNFFLRTLPPLLWDARERTAEFLGTAPQRLVFTSNVSAAINLVASGLRLNSPGEILMTDHEYGAMIWCWERAARRQGLSVRKFALPTMPSDPQEIVDACVAALSPRTRVLFFSHVLSPTGMVLPAERVCAEARKRGILTVVDGAHAPAMIDLNLAQVNADFYGANLHKWLLAPTGAGFLALGPGQEDRLDPLHVSWGYHPTQNPVAAGIELDRDARDAFGSTPRIRFLEFEGSRDAIPWLVVPDAIAFQAQFGWPAIRERFAELSAYSRARIRLPFATPSARGLHGAMTAFELPAGTDAVELRKALWAARIEIPVVERPERLLLRVSHHWYTTEAEIDRVAEFVDHFFASA